MVIALVLLTIVVFVLVDVALRLILQRVDRARTKKERMAALDLGLRLEIADEAKSLRSVEVDAPRARILAVDDEPIVLDSFRKILVLDGYSVSTVESGEEALGLIQKNDYDFVFTDLKMPGLTGLDVTRAVKHMRPDIDVVMITGYGTVETAVGAMKDGALDFVEKPFTEDELTAFVNKSLIRRQARIAEEQVPRVHLVTATEPESDSERVFNVPAGVFISPAHVWVRIELSGDARLGMDDFSRKTIGEIDGIAPPAVGDFVRKGDGLFSVKHDTHRVTFPSPVTGTIAAVNENLEDHFEHLTANPYEIGWVCRITPQDLATDLQPLRIGAAALAWYQEEIDRFQDLKRDVASKRASDSDRTETPVGSGEMPDELWERFSDSFLRA